MAEAEQAREIGIFCGTFNPIHWGHLLLAESARDQFRLEKVFIVTSAIPPHRSEDILDATWRHEMVKAACRDCPHFEPSSIELERIGPSYTVDTLRHYSRVYERARLNLILGQDNLSQLKTWHEPDVLFQLCRILVASRHSAITPAEIGSDLPDTAQVAVIEFPNIPVSSSMVKQRLREGRTVRFLVTPAVHDLLLSGGHYGEPAKLESAGFSAGPFLEPGGSNA